RITRRTGLCLSRRGFPQVEIDLDESARCRREVGPVAVQRPVRLPRAVFDIEHDSPSVALGFYMKPIGDDGVAEINGGIVTVVDLELRGHAGAGQGNEQYGAATARERV